MKHIPPTMNRYPKSVSIHRNRGKFVFIVPFIILLFGGILYFILFPGMGEEGVNILIGLFTDPQRMITLLCGRESVLSQRENIIGIRAFWGIWLTAFITSLFFVGRQLQSGSGPKASEAILTGKEPYLLVQDIYHTLEQTKMRKDSRTLNSLMYDVKSLGERLAVESDFGYGNSDVINCENSIAQEIQLLSETASHIDDSNFQDRISKMSTAVSNTNSLLKKRIELKKVSARI